MSDAPRPDQERLWRIMRDADPPAGARERVRAGVERRLGRRGPRRALALATCAAGAVAVIAALWAGRGDPDDSIRVVSASSASHEGRALAAGEAASGPVKVAETGRLRLAVDGAEIDIAGPAAIEVRAQQVFIREGRVEIRGSTAVSGPGCEAQISGRAEVNVSRADVVVSVFAGSAQVAPAGATTCTVIDLSRAPDRRREASGSRTGAADIVKGEPGPAPPTDAALARQVEAYWAAERMRADDPAGALARFEALRRDWPGSPLGHEIDLAIIDLLVRLEDAEAARARAREFVRRYPESPRRKDVVRITVED
jgi:hypothetical protein